MNMVAATVERRHGAWSLWPAMRESRDDVLAAQPGLASYVGRAIVLGMRPDKPGGCVARRSRGRSATTWPRQPSAKPSAPRFSSTSRSTRGRPSRVRSVRGLAEAVGDDRALEQLASGSASATLVGRFSSRTRIREGDQLEAAVDPNALHFFDAESGHAIHDSTTATASTDFSPAALSREYRTTAPRAAADAITRALGTCMPARRRSPLDTICRLP